MDANRNEPTPARHSGDGGDDADSGAAAEASGTGAEAVAGTRADELAQRFERERSRLVSLASRVLGDPNEAQDIVQQAWLRLDRTEQDIDNLPAWLTTVTTRLCLDRLRRRTPVPEEDHELPEPAPDPAEDVALADTVGVG